jgi:DNA-binding GntR family transcriptional regulator
MSRLAPEPRPLSLTESAYGKIRGAILDGELTPGTPLSVVALAQTLQMSRSPVRAAIERIMAEGLLEPMGGGVVVANLTPNAVFDSMAVRELLEAGAAVLAAPRFTPADVNSLAVIHDEFKRAYAAADARSAMRADLAFHQAIQSRCGNSVLSHHLDRVLSSIMVVTYSDAWSIQSQLEGVPEHAAILTAFRLGDSLLARIAVATHIHAARERLQLAWAAREGAAADETAQTQR